MTHRRNSQQKPSIRYRPLVGDQGCNSHPKIERDARIKNLVRCDFLSDFAKMRKMRFSLAFSLSRKPRAQRWSKCRAQCWAGVGIRANFLRLPDRGPSRDKKNKGFSKIIWKTLSFHPFCQIQEKNPFLFPFCKIQEKILSFFLFVKFRKKNPFLFPFCKIKEKKSFPFSFLRNLDFHNPFLSPF